MLCTPVPFAFGGWLNVFGRHQKFLSAEFPARLYDLMIEKHIQVIWALTQSSKLPASAAFVCRVLLSDGHPSRIYPVANRIAEFKW